MNTPQLIPSDTPIPPGTYKFLKITHLVICGLGIAWILLSLLGVVAGALSGGNTNQTSAKGNAGGEAVAKAIIFPVILWCVIGLGILAVHCVAAWKMLRRSQSFRIWNNIYGIASVSSKVIYLILGIFSISLMVSAAKSEAAKSDPLGYALAGNAVDSEMSKLSTQFTLFLLVYLVVTAIYPAVTLILNNLKPISDYSAALKNAGTLNPSADKSRLDNPLPRRESEMGP